MARIRATGVDVVGHVAGYLARCSARVELIDEHTVEAWFPGRPLSEEDEGRLFERLLHAWLVEHAAWDADVRVLSAGRHDASDGGETARRRAS